MIRSVIFRRYSGICMHGCTCVHAIVSAYVVDMCTCMHVWSVCMYVWHVDNTSCLCTAFIEDIT